jgi:hypothetical protein
MDTRPLLTSAGLELFGALVAEGAVQTLAIVEDFDVLEDRGRWLNLHPRNSPVLVPIPAPLEIAAPYPTLHNGPLPLGRFIDCHTPSPL